jgi:hypothetical protein
MQPCRPGRLFPARPLGFRGGGGGWGSVRDEYATGGGGGSGFASGPGVTGGRTTAGSGQKTAGKSDPLHQAGVGDAGQPGQVVLQWDDFTVAPCGPPDVELTQGAGVDYPGVRIEGAVAFAPVSVTGDARRFPSGSSGPVVSR